MMQKSDVKFIAPQDMIWKSAKLFWTARGCHRQHHRHLKNLDGVSIAVKTPTVTSTWLRSI
jgi:hypothetical protein